MLKVHQTAINHINSVNSQRITAGIPRPINMLELWQGKKSCLDGISMSGQRRDFFEHPPFPVTVYRDQSSPGLFRKSMSSSDGTPVFAFKTDRLNAAFFALYSHDRKDFYLLNAMDALQYPRGLDENQAILGRVLGIQLHQEQEAVEFLLDTKNRGKEIADIANGHPDAEFFHPFFAHEAFLKPNEFWEARINDSQQADILDRGEEAKLRGVLYFLENIRIDPNCVVFDPACGTGMPISVINTYATLNNPRFYISDRSPHISRFAQKRILADSQSAEKGDIPLSAGYGDAISCNFTGFDRDKYDILPWIGQNSVNLLLLRFLNQGVIRSYSEAQTGLGNLLQFLAPGGTAFMFGYSSTFLNSFDIDLNRFDIGCGSLGVDDGLMFSIKNGQMSLDFTTFPKTWIFPFYMIQKK